MTVHFIGAGPGAADLLTLRAIRILEASPVCLYAGSIVTKDVLRFCPPHVRLVDTASMCLYDIEAEILSAHRAGHDVARLHSGDLSIYSAMGEQIRRLKALNIPYTLTPGVPSFGAAAARLGVELTVPRLAQTVVLTRLTGRASPMPKGEALATYAATGATLAIHLAAHRLDEIVAVLTPHYGEDCPVAIVSHVSCPQEQVFKGKLSTISAVFEQASVKRTAMILVGHALSSHCEGESALYSSDYARRFRKGAVSDE